MTTDPRPQPEPSGAVLRPIARRHPSRWIGSAILFLALAMFVQALVVNENLQWGVVGRYLFDAEIIDRKSVV